MNSTNELVTFLKKQIKIERQIVSSLNQSLSEISNPSVKGVLRGISFDSIKHAEMYEAAVKLLTEIIPPLKQEHLDTQVNLVNEHIQLEAQLIERIRHELPTITNDKVQLLINAILADEMRHHQLLTDVLQILVRGETITEEDWWDLIWKNVPFHGSPGG